MVAIVSFLWFLGPRPSRPRWGSKDRRRSTCTPQGPKQSEGRLDGTFLFREEWARSDQGKKVSNGRCRCESETERSEGALRSDQHIETQMGADLAITGMRRGESDTVIYRYHGNGEARSYPAAQYTRIVEPNTTNGRSLHTPYGGLRDNGRRGGSEQTTKRRRRRQESSLPAGRNRLDLKVICPTMWPRPQAERGPTPARNGSEPPPQNARWNEGIRLPHRSPCPVGDCAETPRHAGRGPRPRR